MEEYLPPPQVVVCVFMCDMMCWRVYLSVAKARHCTASTAAGAAQISIPRSCFAEILEHDLIILHHHRRNLLIQSQPPTQSPGPVPRPPQDPDNRPSRLQNLKIQTTPRDRRASSSQCYVVHVYRVGTLRGLVQDPSEVQGPSNRISVQSGGKFRVYCL